MSRPRDPESVYRGKPDVAMPLFDFAGERVTQAVSKATLTSPAVHAHARKTDPQTSHAAAASVRGITETQQAILHILGLGGGLTDEQLVQAYQIRASRLVSLYPKASPSGIRSRRAELVRKGLVCDSGATAKISTGRQATVWRLK